MSIGKNIRRVRIEEGLTQKELGDRCGIAGSAIRRYETGQTQPGAKKLQSLAAALGVSVSVLLPDLDSGEGIIERDPEGNFRTYDKDSPEEMTELYLNHMDEKGKETVLNVAKAIARSQGYKGA